MQIKILFDKGAVDDRFSTGWGFSCLVDNEILFDTGEKPYFLLRNMDHMGIKPSDLKTVVISHDHWDHRGGLWGILKESSKLKIFACSHFSNKFKNRVRLFKAQLIEVDKFTQITNGIYTTGEIEGRFIFRQIFEQALVLETEKGLTIITGCAHPRIINIIENVKRNISGNIYLVLGGFHLMGKREKTVRPIANEFKRLEVKKVAPGHCTGKTATKVFKEIYNDDFIEVKAGVIIDI